MNTYVFINVSTLMKSFSHVFSHAVINSYQTCGFHLLDEESGEKLLRLTMNEGPDTYLQTRMCHIDYIIPVMSCGLF